MTDLTNDIYKAVSRLDELEAAKQLHAILEENHDGAITVLAIAIVYAKEIGHREAALNMGELCDVLIKNSQDIVRHYFESSESSDAEDEVPY